MKLQILSDLHLEFENFHIDHSDADIVVLAGDTHIGDKGVKWASQNITDKPVIYILGNHEYYKNVYPKLLKKLQKITQNTNVHILENEKFTWQDVSFLGCTLWTNFELFGDPSIAGYECQQKMNDFKKIRREPNYSKLRSIDASNIHHRSLHWLCQQLEELQQQKTVVITHHAPSPKSLLPDWEDDLISACYASDLEYLLAKYSPQCWIHGHIHKNFDYQIGNTRIICNPRGYPEENAFFQSKLVVEI